MHDLLIHADTCRSPEQRHELPLMIPDPFLFVEHAGAAYAVLGLLDADNAVAARPDLTVMTATELGYDQLLAAGSSRVDAEWEVAVRACQRIGVGDALVPETFPVELADRLRAAGVHLQPSGETFSARRRVKTPGELDGIRRAQRAADAGVAAAAELLRAAEIDDGALRLDGMPLTSERVRSAIHVALGEHDAIADAIVVAAGAEGAVGHALGTGPIPAHTPLIVDIWPCDRTSSCFADITRTFVVGEVDPELRTWHNITRDALTIAREAIHPGAIASDVHRRVAEHYTAHGHATQLTKAPGELLRDGFFHGLGHGIGLWPHELPVLGPGSDTPIVAGEVFAIEPGTYRSGWGGVRLEDLVLVTDDGAEVLTTAPYDLEP